MLYIPSKGDVIFLDFNPSSGHEQNGHRPAIVVSNFDFNKATEMAIVCPITNTINKRPYRVLLPEEMKTTGIVLCEQVKSLDIKARKAYFSEKAPDDLIDKVVNMIGLFL